MKVELEENCRDPLMSIAASFKRIADGVTFISNTVAAIGGKELFKALREAEAIHNEPEPYEIHIGEMPKDVEDMMRSIFGDNMGRAKPKDPSDGKH